jgi:hypothetical protein
MEGSKKAQTNVQRLEEGHRRRNQRRERIRAGSLVALQVASWCTEWRVRGVLKTDHGSNLLIVCFGE